jgi:hypothetical protein
MESDLHQPAQHKPLCYVPIQGSLQELVVGFEPNAKRHPFLYLQASGPQKNNIVEAIKFKGT